MIVTLYRCPSCLRSHRDIGPPGLLAICGCTGDGTPMTPVANVVDCGDFTLLVTQTWQ